MPLDFGSATTSAFYVGSTAASAIYQGSTQVWPTAAPPSGPALAGHYSSLTTTAVTSRTITGVTAASGTVMVLIACTAIGNTTKYITAVTDSAGNTWTMRQHVVGAPGTFNSGVEIWTSTVSTALSSGTVTIVSGSQTTMGNYDISVWSGVTTTGIVGATHTTVGSATPTPSTVTTTGAAVVLGGLTYGVSGAPVAGPGSGFTTLSGGSSNSTDYGVSAYQIVTTGGTYGPAWTLPSNTGNGSATIGLPSL